MPDLATLVNELNALADEQQDEVRRVEEHYQALKLGIEAAVPVNKDLFLSYCKFADNWRICVTSTEGNYIKPFSDCKRDIRFDCYPYLDALGDKIAGILRTKISQIKKVR